MRGVSIAIADGVGAGLIVRDRVATASSSKNLQVGISFCRWVLALQYHFSSREQPGPTRHLKPI